MRTDFCVWDWTVPHASLNLLSCRVCASGPCSLFAVCVSRAGESLAQVLCLAGVRPVADSIGRVNKLELIPLEELGRPRIDVVVSCSGVFRDLFINQMNLLDRGVSIGFCFFCRLLSLGGVPGGGLG